MKNSKIKLDAVWGVLAGIAMVINVVDTFVSGRKQEQEFEDLRNKVDNLERKIGES